MLLGCISTASAGWFDFGGDDSNDLNATIANQSVTYESAWVVDTGNLGLQERLPDGKEDVMQGYKIKSEITLDLSNASSNQKDKIKNMLKEDDTLYVTVYPTVNDSFNITLFGTAKFSDDKLSITANELLKAETISFLTGGNWAESGYFVIGKGNATISSNDTNMTINFNE